MDVMSTFSARWRYLLVSLVVGLLWAAPLAAEAPSSDSSLRKISVQLKWRHQFQFAGFYAAVQQGYYREAGLEVDLIEYTSGKNPIDQLMQGRVEFAVADTGALIYRSTGVPLVALAVIFQHSPSILLSRDDRGITTLADLRFRPVMVAGGFMNAELLAMLKNGGLSYEELNLVPSSTSIMMLIEDRVAAFNAYTTNEPYFMEQMGVPYRIFHPRDYGVDFYGDTLYTTERLIRDDPELVETFRAASLKGWTYAVEHPEETVDIILANYNTQNKTREHLMFEAQQAIELILPDVVPIGYMNEERWRRIESVFKEQGLDRGVDLEKFIYSTAESGLFWRVLHRYRLEIFIAVILLVSLLLTYHIFSLRFQIQTHTQALQVAKRKAEQEARTDELTELPNRRHFLESAARDIALAERNNVPISVIVADIDFFKNINDTYGHVAGDETLRRVSDVLRRNVRSGDMAARIGGEEFAVLCFDASLEKTRNLAERLRQEIEQTTIEYESERFNITFSFGLAVRDKDQSIEQVLQVADRALYEAKRSGRNTIRA